MREDDLPENEHLPTRSLDDLVVPQRPADIPYPAGDDYDAMALLTANGYSFEPAGLINLLDSGLGIFQSAAARLLGLEGVTAAIPALKQLLESRLAEETARVQAAFALARMNVPGAKDRLIDFLDMNPLASPAPLQAASALAQLGDPQGFTVVHRALESPNPLVAMIACKQLHAFVSYDGQPISNGDHVSVYDAYRHAAVHMDALIRGEAQAQLAALDTEQARLILNTL